MRKLAVVFCLLTMCGQAFATVPILLETPSGKLIAGPANMAAACAQTQPIHITSALSAVQSNISTASGATCLAPINIHPGGSINPTTKFVAPNVIDPTPQKFGAVGDDSHDDTAAFKVLLGLAGIPTTSEFHQRITLHIPAPTTAYKISDTLVIYGDVYALKGDQAALDFSSMNNSKAAILYTSVGPNQQPYYNGTGGITGIQIKGPGTGGSSIGIRVNAPNFPGACFNVIRDCIIYEFNTGITTENFSFALTFDNVKIHDNYYGLHTINGISDGGERIYLTGCAVYNNSINVLAETSTSPSLFITGTSLDSGNLYNVQVNTGYVSIDNCHMEDDNNPATTQIYSTGGFISVDHSFINIANNSVSNPVISINSSSLNISNSFIQVPINYPEIIQADSTSVYNELSTKMLYSGTTAAYTLASGTRYNISSVDSSRELQKITAGFQAAQITNTGGIYYNNENSISIPANNSWNTLFITGQLSGRYGGLYIFKDITAGGVAVFAADLTGVTQISNTITGFSMRYNSGTSGMQININASGTHQVNWSVVASSLN